MNADNEAMLTVESWLKTWAEAIRAKDFAKGETLFCANASGFGTVTFITDGLNDLLNRQWRAVWPRTRNFSFHEQGRRIHISPDQLQACIQTIWSSLGDSGDGAPCERTGRATIILIRRSRDVPWKCVHTHFSMWPDGADLQTAASAQY